MNDTGSTSYDFLRVRIEGTLVTCGLLHCGDGNILAPEDWDSEGGPRQGRINSVCLGAQGPYIPASTLRGSLRDRCVRSERLFGTAHGDQGQAGAVRVFDAARKKGSRDPGDLHWNTQRKTSLRDGVSLDPVTGTAAEGRLFAFEVVPDGTRFELSLEADRVTKAELAELLGLLAAWKGTADTAIGRGRSKGWGGIECLPELRVSAIRDEDIRTWLDGKADSPPRLKPIAAPAPAKILAGAAARLTVTLSPATPLLVNDAARIKPRAPSGQEYEKAGESNPQLEFMRTAEGEALIPGSSIRGVLRAQARRILATIAHQCFERPPNEAAEIADSLLTPLFGTERRRSPLWIGDAAGKGTKQHEQFFNAICRFTGGVADRRLYWVRAADCPEMALTVSLDLDPRRGIEGDWWKGLLLLLVRDLYQDQIAVGWGRSRGFGAFELRLTDAAGSSFDNFEALLDHLRQNCAQDTPRAWVASLHAQVQDQIDRRLGEPNP